MTRDPHSRFPSLFEAVVMGTSSPFTLDQIRKSEKRELVIPRAPDLQHEDLPHESSGLDEVRQTFQRLVKHYGPAVSMTPHADGRSLAQRAIVPPPDRPRALRRCS